MTRWLAGTWLALVLLGCAGTVPAPAPSEGPGVPKQLQQRQVIVTLAPATPERWAYLATELAQTYAVRQVGAFPLTSLGIQCIVLQIPPERAVDEVLTQLAADPRVESVQLNQVFEGLGSVHNDPYAPLQYGARLLGADLAHQQVTGRDVTIALVDTGVEIDHPDLRGQVVETANFVDGGELTFPHDRHGTAVAGVIAARADNGTGIFGIAPGAHLIAVKACWQRTASDRQAVCSSWSLAKGLDFVLHTHAQILNLSLGGPADPLLTRLLMAAMTQGITVVAAALEASAQGPGFPASLEGVMAVRASDPAGQVHGEMHGAPRPALAAPGIDILTTVPTDTYDFLSGSSLAAAHVTGVIALVLEANPHLSPAQVSTLLRATAHPVPATAQSAPEMLGVVDVCTALAHLEGGHACRAEPNVQ
jgi:subtilisin family serine protease